ncbi:MAG: ligand-binding sensor domain-containing protein, partial [Bacteroidia bacterium]
MTCTLDTNDTLWIGTERSGMYYVGMKNPMARYISKAYQGNYNVKQLKVDSNKHTWSPKDRNLSIRKEGNMV